MYKYLKTVPTPGCLSILIARTTKETGSLRNRVPIARVGQGMVSGATPVPTWMKGVRAGAEAHGLPPTLQPH